jgi:hypothetical protein
MDIAKKPLQKKTILLVFASVLSSFITLGILSFLINSSHYGYDFTDESHYMLMIQYYEIYKHTISNFGFIYQPIANLLNYNIPNLRIFSILATFCLSGLVVFLMYYYSLKDERLNKKEKFSDFTSIFGLATSSLLYFSTFNWLPTPSYNSLNFQGILIVVVGLIISHGAGRLSCWLGVFALSLGGWVVFMAKPSSALLIGVACFFILLFNGKMRFLNLLLIFLILIILFLISFYILGGNFAGFIERYKTALEGSRVLGCGHEFSSMWRFDFPPLSKGEWGCFLSLSALATVLFLSLRLSGRNARIVVVVLTVVFLSAALFVYQKYIESKINFPYFSSIQILSIPVGVILSVMFVLICTKTVPRCKKLILLGLFFLIIPYIYAFGTNNNYFYSSSAVAFFWFLGGLCLLGSVDLKWMLNSLLPISFLAQLSTVVFLLNAVQSPYRQPMSLFEATEEVKINNSTLNVNKNIAIYFDEIRKIGKVGEFNKEDFVIDFTGCSPGFAIVLGSRNLGVSWLFGGYPGSNERALFYLNKVPYEKILKAWVLTEPSGKLALNPGILSNWGLSLENDYELIGEVLAPAGYRGASEPSLQKIYKPKTFRISE